MIICRTPFRVSFFGGGTDYPAWYQQHGGAFLSTTINRHCYVMVRRLPPFFQAKGRITWSRVENINTVQEIENPVVRECLRFLDFEPSLDIHYHGDLPARSGLGTSSAFTVGLLYALHSLRDEFISKRALATEAITVERDYIGDEVGVQDQTAVAHGGLNHCVIDRRGDVTVQSVVLPPGRTRELERHVMLFFTGVSRTAAAIAESKVRHMPDRVPEMQRIRALVDEGLEVLQGGDDIQAFGQLLHEGWQMKRALSSAVSTDAVDQAYASARRAGAIGGKLLGAGGGGFLMLFAPPARHQRIIDALPALRHVPVAFERDGSQVIFYDPEDRGSERPAAALAAS